MNAQSGGPPPLMSFRVRPKGERGIPQTFNGQDGHEPEDALSGRASGIPRSPSRIRSGLARNDNVEGYSRAGSPAPNPADFRGPKVERHLHLPAPPARAGVRWQRSCQVQVGIPGARGWSTRRTRGARLGQRLRDPSVALSEAEGLPRDDKCVGAHFAEHPEGAD